MFGQSLLSAFNSTVACTTDTVQILDGTPLESIATYQLNNATTSIPNNTYPGTASNVTYTTGKFGQAAVFNGSSSNISIGTELIPATSNFSLSFWINRNTSSDSDLFNQATSSGDIRTYFKLFSNGTFGVFSAGTNGSRIQVPNTTSAITNGQWEHIAIVRDGSNMTFYINGTGETETISGGTVGVGRGDLTIGSASAAPDAIIDQVRIFNTALSAGEVTILYNETVATASNSYINLPSGVAYYKMSDATDQTGSYDGTATDVNFNVAGKFGNAGEFNGSSSKVLASVPKSSNQSFSFWTKHGTQSNSTATYLGYSNTGSNGFFSLCISSGNFSILYWNGSTYARNTSTINIADNTWHHVILNTVGNVFTIYLDGNTTPVYTTTLSGFTHATRNDLQISFETPDGAASYFNGSIDQVRIFNRVITSTEVETLYDEVQCIPTIVPTDYFEPVIYTGNGTTQSITSLDFQPDLVWAKSRSASYSNRLFDSVRGAAERIMSNSTDAEATAIDELTAFGSNGFTLSNGVGVNQSSATYVSWNWKAGGTAVSNTDGTITSQVSANVDAGFSIVEYTGTGSNASFGHGLSSVPELVIVKRTSASEDWFVLYDTTNTPPNYMKLNTTATGGTSSGVFPSPATSTFVNVGNGTATNSSGSTYIAYCFHSVDGFSKIGSYVGTGTVGNSIVTGFRPAFMLFRAVDIAFPWELVDNKRPDGELRADNSDFERIENTPDFLQNGFRLTTDRYNNAGQKFIFMAIAEENVQPEPELANSFNVVTYTGNGSTQAVTGLGFEPDFVWIKERTSTSGHFLSDSVRGATKVIYSNLNNSEDTETTTLTSFDTNGFSVGSSGGVNQSSQDYVAWAWKASNDSTINNEGSITSVVSANPAAGFSVVKWKGSGTSGQSIGHGLNSEPELILQKRTNIAGDWECYHKDLGATKKILLNSTAAATTSSAFGNTAPTSTVSYAGAYTNELVNYYFHSVDGYQKVGSYTGNATSGNSVTTGFQPRFVMMKNSSTGDALYDYWLTFDSQRDGFVLYPNTSDSEDSFDVVEFTSNGFTINTTSRVINHNGSTYIYLAIA